MVDWSKPLELNDGRGVKLGALSGYRKIKLAHPQHPHPLFPAPLREIMVKEDGTVPDSVYRVRNREGGKGLDLTIKVGDRVRSVGPLPCSGAVLAISGDMVTVYNSVQKSTGQFHVTDLVHTCHNHDAPFTKTVLNEERARRDGYVSGLYWGLKGQQYAAGGPYTRDARTGCPHVAQDAEFLERNNAAWKEGWADGQKASSEPRAPIDWKLPLVRLDTGEIVKACGEGFVSIDGQAWSVARDGVCDTYHTVIENKARLGREGYLIVGTPHVALEATLEAISEHYHKLDYKRGYFIARVTQTRATGHDQWETIDISGPINPMPKIVKETVDVTVQNSTLRVDLENGIAVKVEIT